MKIKNIEDIDIEYYQDNPWELAYMISGLDIISLRKR